MAEPKWLKDLKPDDYLTEDFDVKKAGRYTVEGIDPNDPDWLEKAAEKTHAASGDDYVKLDAGLMTVNQLNWMFRAAYGELTYVDENNEFLWYNRPLDPKAKMHAKRVPAQVGDTLDQVHPHVRDVIPTVKKVVYALRNKVDGQDAVEMPIPSGSVSKFILHHYKRVEDEDGNYRGIYEWVQDLYPIVKYYLEATGQKLVDDPDAVSGATFKADATSEASTKLEAAKEEKEVDSTTSASE